MNIFLLASFAILFFGGIGLLLFELFFPSEIKQNNPGDAHGASSGKPRVIAYVVCAIVGFIAMIIELMTVY